MDDDSRKFQRLTQHGARALNWAAFIILFIFIGIAIIN